MDTSSPGLLLGNAPALLQALERAHKCAPFDDTVVLRGESGTGKTILASWIHSWSGRQGAFRRASPGSVGDELLLSDLFGHVKGAFTGAIRHRVGLLEETAHGTLFLDEVSRWSARLQLSMLDILDRLAYRRTGGARLIGPTHRLVVATNANLEALVASGEFAEDLYYRLGRLHIVMPPLSERREDIVMLAESFLRGLASANAARHVPSTFTPEALELLVRAPWPGNVRQLRDVVRGGGIRAVGEPAVAIEHLEIDETPVSRLADCRTPQERIALVADALHRSGGNKSDAARRIRASRRTVIRYASQLAGLRGADPGPAPRQAGGAVKR